MTLKEIHKSIEKVSEGVVLITLSNCQKKKKKKKKKKKR